jgi:hypothetical protein
MNKKKKSLKWGEAEMFLFAHERLRAQTIPNKKRVASKNACRGRHDRNA